jgi:hypothetical protein
MVLLYTLMMLLGQFGVCLGLLSFDIMYRTY